MQGEFINFLNSSGLTLPIDGGIICLDTVEEFMKRLFCRPYGTNPGVHALCPSSNGVS
jgi:hypothetical protein